MKLFGNRKGAEHIAARKTEKKTGGLKRWQRVTIIVAAIVLVLGGTALAVYKVNVKPPVKQPEPVETEPLPEEETVKKPTVYVPATEVDEETGEETEIETEVPASHRAGVYNILIAGTDGDGYRTDTIIVAHLDENTHEVALMSVPRDTAVMNGNGGLMKINSVYANGKEEGMERLERRLSSLLGFEMDGYVLVNLDAFIKIVDLVGGVTVNVPRGFSDLHGRHVRRPGRPHAHRHPAARRGDHHARRPGAAGQYDARGVSRRCTDPRRPRRCHQHADDDLRRAAPADLRGRPPDA